VAAHSDCPGRTKHATNPKVKTMFFINLLSFFLARLCFRSAVVPLASQSKGGPKPPRRRLAPAPMTALSYGAL
jgi:uncharacterized membrane protein YhhN